MKLSLIEGFLELKNETKIVLCLIKIILEDDSCYSRNC